MGNRETGNGETGKGKCEAKYGNFWRLKAMDMGMPDNKTTGGGGYRRSGNHHFEFRGGAHSLGSKWKPSFRISGGCAFAWLTMWASEFSQVGISNAVYWSIGGFEKKR
jgi:hypothetical protein